MVRVLFSYPDGREHEVDLPESGSLMQAIVQSNLGGVVAECGGAAMCGTCHVYLDASGCTPPPPPEAIEDALLDFTAAERLPESRLSCQINLSPDLNGLVVRFPMRQ